MLPGDTIRATPFIVGPEGPIDADAVRPAWFYCGVPLSFQPLSARNRLAV